MAKVAYLERSGEGSAPNGSGSKDGMGNSRAAMKSGSGGNGSGNGIGNSATKQCQGSNQPNGESGHGRGTNGNSATTKDGTAVFGNGNSGNDASTSRQVSHAAHKQLLMTGCDAPSSLYSRKQLSCRSRSDAGAAMG